MSEHVLKEEDFIARATILNQQLERCHAIIAQVIGPHSQKDNRPNQAPDNLAQQLSYLLYDARNEADELVVQLERLVKKFDSTSGGGT